MRRWRGRLLAVLAIAALVHLAAVWAVPRLIMHRLMTGLAAAGADNAALRPPRPTDAARSVVMPSPDLLYAICRYDVSKRPLRIAARVPASYWSVALFADNSDNFFTLDDRAAGEGPVELVLAAQGARVAAPAGARVIAAPSDTGVVLFRLFVPNEKALPALAAAQQEERCAPLAE